jgi:hypothetical protein
MFCLYELCNPSLDGESNALHVFLVSRVYWYGIWEKPHLSQTGVDPPPAYFAFNVLFIVLVFTYLSSPLQ